MCSAVEKEAVGSEEEAVDKEEAVGGSGLVSVLERCKKKISFSRMFNIRTQK